MKFFILVIILALVAFISIIIWQMTAYKVSEPAYTTIKSDGDIAIREYASMIVAEVNVSGERYTAINSGFRILANYIFGGNKQKMQIAMTAPVIQSQDSDKLDTNQWIVRFVMPADYDLQKLPQPDNTQVKLIKVTKKKYIVIRFSGSNTDTNLNNHLNELESYIAKNNLETQGSPVYAFYNPPWILPFLRRNEIMLELKL